MTHNPGNMPYQPEQFRKWNKVGAPRAIDRCITQTTSGRFKVQIWDGEKRQYIGVYEYISDAKEARDKFEAEMRPVDGRTVRKR